MCLGEHHGIGTKFLVLDDLQSEGLLLLLVVQAPYVREEDAKLERGRSIVMSELLIRLLIVYLYRVMTISLGGPLGVPHVFARLKYGLLS